MQPLDQLEVQVAAEKQFYKSKLLELYRLRYELGCNLPPEINRIKEKISILREEKRALNKKDLMFITINPKPGVLITEFMEYVKKDAHRAMFRSGIWCFEQRGKDTLTEGTGLHAHLALVRDPSYKPSKIHKILAESWLKRGLIGNKKHVDVRAYPLSFMAEKEEYMTGKKWDKDKAQAVEINKAWRVKLGIKNIYVRDKEDAKMQR